MLNRIIEFSLRNRMLVMIAGVVLLVAHVSVTASSPVSELEITVTDVSAMSIRNG